MIIFWLHLLSLFWYWNTAYSHFLLPTSSENGQLQIWSKGMSRQVSYIALRKSVIAIDLHLHPRHEVNHAFSTSAQERRFLYLLRCRTRINLKSWNFHRRSIISTRGVGRCKILGRPGQETKCALHFFFTDVWQKVDPLKICAVKSDKQKKKQNKKKNPAAIYLLISYNCFFKVSNTCALIGRSRCPAPVL